MITSKGFYSFAKCRVEARDIKAKNTKKTLHLYSNKLKAFVIESFYSGAFNIVQLSKLTGLTINTVKNILDKYFVPIDVERFIITKKSNIFS